MNLMKKYDMFNRDKIAIFCNERYGPTFGGCDNNNYYRDLYLIEDLIRGYQYQQ